MSKLTREEYLSVLPPELKAGIELKKSDVSKALEKLRDHYLKPENDKKMFYSGRGDITPAQALNSLHMDFARDIATLLNGGSLD